MMLIEGGSWGQSPLANPAIRTFLVLNFLVAPIEMMILINKEAHTHLQVGQGYKPRLKLEWLC